MVYVSRWTIGIVVLVVLLGIAYAAPNLVAEKQLKDLPSWIPSSHVNLGLDLQGGSHLLLEVETDEVVEDKLNGLVEGVRTALREARIHYRGLGVEKKAVTVRILKQDKVAQAEEALEDQLGRNVNIAEGDEAATFRLYYSEDTLREFRTKAVKQSIEIVRRRIDELGMREPNIQRQGDKRIVVELPGVDEPGRIKEILGRTAQLTLHLVDEDASVADARKGRLPPGSKVVPYAERTGPDGEPLRDVIRKRVIISGEQLEGANGTMDQQSGGWIVGFNLNTRGAEKFGKVTQDNVGRRLAIVLDGEIVSAPVIRQPILGGRGQISGDFSPAEAKNLALLLRAGALPAPLRIMQERTVGPGLGQDSIEAGKAASIIGLVLVIIFMLLTYGLFGLFANVGLLLNIVFILAGLSILQATLTLPGIAGIVLTIGMAVDANVLIFERIKEENRRGRSVISAVDTGYREAFRTIVDANVTTFIAALLLFIFGSGPVRGFAVTLSIGLVTSMFTAILVTRLMVVAWLRGGRKPLTSKILPI